MKPLWLVLFAAIVGVTATASADSVIEPASTRFAKSDAAEVPNFRQHVMPLLGKLGCNSRACHGSFQGQGGFRLSLFGYDSQLDHTGLAERVDKEKPENSYALQKPLLEEPHRGGKRLSKDSWEYNLLISWIKGGAANENREEQPKLIALDVTPKEIVFQKDGQTVPLKAMAIWSDGRKEDVTCLCRFQTNDEQVADVSKNGTVTSHQAGDTHVVTFYDNSVVPVPIIHPVSDRNGDKFPNVAVHTKVDELVVEKLRKLGVVPSQVASDTEFLRRASLDVTGTLPGPKEINEFVADADSRKRAKKIDELLSRPAYAAWWATRLSDWTSNGGIQNNNSPIPADAYTRDWYDFIRVRLERNEPYDKIAEGFVMANSLESGESYRDYCETLTKTYHPTEGPRSGIAERSTMPYYWARRMFQTAEDRVIGFSYNFLGVRIQCAQCHKHPFDQWTMDEFHQFKNFFTHTSAKNGVSPGNKSEYTAMQAELAIDKKANGNERTKLLAKAAKEGKTIPFDEIYTLKVQPPKADPKKKAAVENPADPKKVQPGKNSPQFAKLLGQPEPVDLTKYDDPRQPLMDWLRSKENKLFSRAFVNRVWASYFNVGIVQPADDQNLANPPSNAPLLDYLATQFVERGYDIKWLHREICNSDTYQRTWAPNETNKSDERNFSHAVPRRLPAEVAYDALLAATSSDDDFSKITTDLSRRAIAIPESSRRNQGGNGVDSYALSIFGRSIRESNCDCDRSSDASLLQTVYLQNDPKVLELVSSSRGWIRQAGVELGVIKDKKTEKAAVGTEVAKLTAERATYAKRLERLKKVGSDKGVDLIEKQIAKLDDQLAAFKEKSTSSDPEPIAPMDHEKLSTVVKSTYLRTLSRMPTDDELSRTVAYINQSDDKLRGLSDVMWALVNTKEFIVNH